MKQFILAAACLVAVGCVTTPAVGSRVWHEERTAEIEQAYNDWELTEEEYLELKNETDAIRSEYLDRLEQRRRYQSFRFGIGYGFHHHHHFGHFGYHPHW